MTVLKNASKDGGKPASETRDGMIIVVSAPSGAGKTSLCRDLLLAFPQIRHSISHTTRERREGEVDGVDYHFVSSAEFDRMVDDGAFAEWARVHGNCYGTALKTLQEAAGAGFDTLLEIDCQGAAQIRKACPGAVCIFILPPTLDELRRRLEGRGTDSADVVARRLANAKGEIQEAVWYDYAVVNDDFATALEQLKAIVIAEGQRSGRKRSVVDRLLAS